MINGLTTVGGPTKLARIAFYVDPEVKEKLEKLAGIQRRTLSNLMAVIAEKAVEEAEKEELADEPE
ncbi:hypothetical protein [Lyngbya sp. CCY1209]|uniref:ribbon-helix-helix domain-containing protein n=1 Tax=Lyngbya sp. CCY1209 TaxID=2886103 RepID=UPI002D217829|nr:hypothetical protein [Lyngbya sp. CCY1209]MEB3882334.1 hypothetical protein [Lyngbya sp. CCY1209]